MKRFLLATLVALFLVSSAFSQRLWVKDGYIRLYNPTSKQDFYTLVQSISRIYIKGNEINVYTFSPSADFTIDYAKLTQYNGSTVPTLATIGADLNEAIVASIDAARNLGEMQGKYGKEYVRDTFNIVGDFYCASFINETAIDQMIWDGDTIVSDTMPAGQYIYGPITEFKAADSACRVVLYKTR
jgi:hypothetical protein